MVGLSYGTGGTGWFWGGQGWGWAEPHIDDKCESGGGEDQGKSICGQDHTVGCVVVGGVGRSVHLSWFGLGVESEFGLSGTVQEEFEQIGG